MHDLDTERGTSHGLALQLQPVRGVQTGSGDQTADRFVHNQPLVAALQLRRGWLRHLHRPKLATQILLLRAQGRGGLPKGISAATLALVLDTVRGAAGGITAVDASEQAGISRGTARRYLEYLEKSGTIQLTLRDGSTGRPEHLSSWAGVASSS